MQKKQTKTSTCKVIDKKTGKVVGYLTKKDEAKGEDIKLDRQGYTIVAL